MHLKYLSEAGILTIMLNFYLRERCSSAAPPSVKVKLNAKSVENLQTFLEGKAKIVLKQSKYVLIEQGNVSGAHLHLVLTENLC